MDTLTVMIILKVLLFISILALIKNNITYKCSTIAGDAIFYYCTDLAKKDTYNMDVNYFTEMSEPYYKHFFSPLSWTPEKAIKKKYRELLKPYLTKAMKEDKCTT